MKLIFENWREAMAARKTPEVVHSEPVPPGVDIGVDLVGGGKYRTPGPTWEGPKARLEITEIGYHNKNVGPDGRPVSNARIAFPYAMLKLTLNGEDHMFQLSGGLMKNLSSMFLEAHDAAYAIEGRPEYIGDEDE